MGEGEITTQEARKQLEEARAYLSSREEEIRSTIKPATRKESFGVASRFRRILTARRAATEPSLREIGEERLGLSQREREIEEIERKNREIEEANLRAGESAQAQRDKVTTLTRALNRGFSLSEAAKIAGLSKREAAELRLEKRNIEFREAQKQELEKVKPVEIEAVPVEKIPEVSSPALSQPKKSNLNKILSFSLGVKKTLTSNVATSKKGVIDILSVARSKIKKEPFGVSRKKISESLQGKPTSLAEDNKSFKELLRQNNLPAAIRKGVNIGGEKIFGLSTRITGQRPSKLDIQKGGKLIGETLAYGVLLGPTAATRGQIARDFLAPVRVQTLGISQRAKKGVVLTDVTYRATKGGISRVGVAKGVTGVKPIEGTKLLRFATGVKGASAQRSLTLRGLRLTKPEAFVGIGQGVAKRQPKNIATFISQELTSTRGAKSRAQIIKSASAGLSLQTKKGISLAKQFTVTNKRTSAIAESVIFNIKKQPKIFRIVPDSKAGQLLTSRPPSITKIYKPVLSLAKQSGLASTKNIIGATSTRINPLIAPRESGLILSGLSFKFPKSSIRTRNLSPLQLTAPQTVREYPRTSPVVNFKLDSGQRSKSISATRSITSQAPLITPRISLAPRQPPRLSPRLRSPQIAINLGRQASRQRFAISFKPFVSSSTRSPPILGFKLKGGMRFPSTRRKKRRSSVITFVPDFTSKVFGITERITPKQLRSRALSPSIFLRKIPLLK